MKIIQSFAKFWNSPIFRISKVWNPSKTATVILGNPEIFKYPIQCRPLGGSVDIFWNSPMQDSAVLKSGLDNLISKSVSDNKAPAYVLQTYH